MTEPEDNQQNKALFRHTTVGSHQTFSGTAAQGLLTRAGYHSASRLFEGGNSRSVNLDWKRQLSNEKMQIHF